MVTWPDYVLIDTCKYGLGHQWWLCLRNRAPSSEKPMVSLLSTRVTDKLLTHGSVFVFHWETQVSNLPSALPFPYPVILHGRGLPCKGTGDWEAFKECKGTKGLSWEVRFPNGMNEWMNEYNKWVNKWACEWQNGWTNEWTDECINRGVNGQPNEHIKDQVNEEMNEWMNEEMNSRVSE